MAEIPALFDRITGPMPRSDQPSYEAKLREVIMRDLSDLLSSVRLSAVQDLDAWPNVKMSTLNYGVDDISGITDRGAQLAAVEASTKEAILQFEPRLDPATVRVRFLPVDAGEAREVMRLLISARLRLGDVRDNIVLEAQINLDTGSVELKEETD